MRTYAYIHQFISILYMKISEKSISQLESQITDGNERYSTVASERDSLSALNKGLLPFICYLYILLIPFCAVIIYLL